MCYLSKKGENGSKGSTEVVRISLTSQAQLAQTWELGLSSLVLKVSESPPKAKGKKQTNKQQPQQQKKQLPTVKGMGLPESWIWKTRVSSQWTQRTQRTKQKYYSWILKPNGTCLVIFQTHLGHITPFFFFLISPFWNRNSCPVPVSPYFGRNWLLISQVESLKGVSPQDESYF